MTMDETIKALSDDARTALTSVKSALVGTVIMDGVATSTLWELEDAHLIGANSGLTIRGSAVAEKLQNAQLEELFG